MQRLRVSLIGLVCVACAVEEPHHAPDFRITPSHASMFGHSPVSIEGDFTSLGAITRVTVGGNALYNLEVTSTHLRGVLQGAPRVGPTTVQVEGERGTLSNPGAFTFDAPAHNVPVGWAAFGGNLTQGKQSKGIDAHSQLWGVTGQLLRAAGVYSGMPLLSPRLATPLTASDFSADCVQRPGTGTTPQSMVSAVTDPLTGQVHLSRARVDPALSPRTLAVAGSNVTALLHGATGDALTLEHMVLEPDGATALTQPVQRPQIVRLETLDADVGISTDLLINDILPAVTDADDVVPARATSVAELRVSVTELFTRLGALHGQYFVANVPDLSFLPNVTRLRHLRVDAGTDTTETFNAKLAAVDSLVLAYNALLLELAAHQHNIHVVDFRRALAVNAPGVMVDGTMLSAARFDGLLSLDDMHFTDTGYALQANVFVDAINGALETDIPHVDVNSVNRADALRPAALRSAGLLCVR